MSTGGQARRPRFAPIAGVVRRVGFFSLAFLVVACAAQDVHEPATQDLSLANRLFSTGYQDISDIYIDEVSVSQLALAGLGSLSTLDPNVTVARQDTRVVLTADGQTVATFTAPADADANGWGGLTAAALRIGRSRSPELAAADAEAIYETVFDGVVSKLDYFSRYAGREEARENRASRDGFGGIGVRIRLIDEGVRVLSVMEDTPAEESGLLDNDVITAIDGQTTLGLSQREVVRRLRGPLRSRVVLTVVRDSAPTSLDIDVVRAHIVPQTVKYERDGNIAVLKVSGFNQSTARTLRDKVVFADEDIGPALDGYILDLRGNPGGLLDQAVAVSDIFVGHGRIVSTHGRHPDSHQYFNAEPGDMGHGRPIVVLINGNSASASEIVAAALQDLGRAVIVGSSSFGKGTVQTVLRLPNQGELTLTWARFHAPSGYALNHRGILPDICTTRSMATVDDVMESLRRGIQPIDHALRSRDIEQDDESAVETLRANCPPRQTDAAIDLEVAERILADPAMFARALGGPPDTAQQMAPEQPAVASTAP